MKRRDTVDDDNPNALRHRFRTPLVLPARQPRQYPLQHAVVSGTRLLQLLVGAQRHFPVVVQIAHPRHLDPELLVGQVDRAWLLAVAHHAGLAALAGIAR